MPFCALPQCPVRAGFPALCRPGPCHLKMAETFDSDSSQTKNTLPVILLVSLLVITLVTGYVAHRSSRTLPVREAVQSRLAILMPSRGLGEEAVQSIPIVKYHSQQTLEPGPTNEHHQSRSANPSTALPTPSPPISPPLLNRFKLTLPFLKNRTPERPNPDGPSTCSICTEDLVEGVDLRKLPCGHVFHPHCVDPWLRDRARTCPLW